MVANSLARTREPRLATSHTTAEVIDQFRAALAERDIVAPECIIADGSIHRCNTAGKSGKGDAAYLLHLDGIPAGGLENWRDGKGWESWRFDIGRALTPAELDGLRIRAQAASARRVDEANRRHGAARVLAERIWHAAKPAANEHPYLVPDREPTVRSSRGRGTGASCAPFGCPCDQSLRPTGFVRG